MANIPPEIWLQIALFIPDDALYQLRCVNSIFLDLALNIYWRKITISTKKIPQSIKLLGRVSDPFIARRVQTLVVSVGNSESKNINECAQDLIISNSDLRKCFETTILDAVSRLSTGFLNLRHLTLDFPNISPSPDSHIQSFLSSLWTSFESKLHGLSLNGNLWGYYLILRNSPILSSLKLLDFQIVNGTGTDGLDVGALLENAADFINRHSHSLEALKIWSCPSNSRSIDLSAFFIHLSSFPSLSALDIRLAFNKSFHDPSGLRQLLWNTSGILQSLSLRLNPSGFTMPWEMELQLAPWLSECLAHSQAFSCLKKLDFYPTRDAEGIAILLEYINRASNHLQEIIIRDQYLHLDEVKAVIDAASECQNLKSIHFNVWEIDINLIDYLSEKLSFIESLTISTVESMVGDFPGAFIRCLRGKSYAAWKLQDISVYYGNREIDSIVMRALGHSISSAKYFFGKKRHDVK